MSGWRTGLALVTLALAAATVEVYAGRAIPLREPLAEVPFRLGEWAARVEPVDPDFLQRARPDEILHRRYTDDAGRTVLLYVGYYRRRATQGQVLAACHGDCQRISSGTMELDLQGIPAIVNRATLRQAGRSVAVLYWYQQGDRIVYDPYREKIEQAKRALLQRRSEGALVRITVPVVSTEQEARQRAAAFAKALYPVLRAHFPD